MYVIASKYGYQESLAKACRVLGITKIPTPPNSLSEGHKLGEIGWSSGYLSNVTASFAIESSPFKGKISGSEKLFMTEYFYVTAETGSAPLLSTLYGVGFRLWVHAKELDLELTTTLPILSAQAELGKCECRIDIERFGWLANEPVMPPINGSLLNFSTYATLEGYIANMSKYISENKDDRNKVKPIIVGLTLGKVSADFQETGTNEFRYSIWKMRQKMSLKSALEDSTRFPELNPSQIREAYAEFTGDQRYLDVNSPVIDFIPDPSIVEKASEWIFRYR